MFQPCNHVVGFPGNWPPHPEATQEPTKNQLIRIKDAPITRDITEMLGALCQETVQDQILELNILLVPLSTKI